MLTFVLAGFLIAHGLIHASYGSPRPPDGPVSWPFELSRSWLLTALGLSETVIRSFGTLLWVLAATGFVGAGLGMLVHLEWWRPLAVAAAVVSLVLLVLYWHPWLVLGPVLDIGILVALLWAQWPPEAVVGS